MALDVALDIGTASTRLATAQRGVLFNEPTMVAIDTSSGDVVEVGLGALELVGRTPRHVVVFRPFAQGATVDFDVTARLIAGLFDRAGISKLSRARVVMSVPSLATAIERRALRQAAIQAGAREVSLVESPLAAAIGLGLPVQDPIGSAVVLLGAGASEVVVVSLGGIVTGRARRIGSSDVDGALATLLRVQRGVVVAPRVVEELKITLADATGSSRAPQEIVAARTVDRGVPVSVEVDSDLVHRALGDVLNALVRMVEECLSDTPPDLSQDVSSRGMTLAGGFAQLSNLDGLLAQATGVDVRVAAQPELVVIQGLQYCLEEMSSLHALFREADR
ncbi:MAG: rod shape-determining protein [Acidobacteriota bacterium]|nr:rod shape-determining protein [Acidobacteriota bacterium]MDE3043273.1 rod shape-determining protein [Acidobacteriota bacterium]MDE3222719.1 rod shape-determining protein [Acidobacteriota bacterium]